VKHKPIAIAFFPVIAISALVVCSAAKAQRGPYPCDDGEYSPTEIKESCAMQCRNFDDDWRNIGISDMCLGAVDASVQHCYSMFLDLCIRNCSVGGTVGKHRFCTPRQ
jgi:hypothetical protein